MVDFLGCFVDVCMDGEFFVCIDILLIFDEFDY